MSAPLYPCANCGEPIYLNELADRDPNSALCQDCSPKDHHGIPIEVYLNDQLCSEMTETPIHPMSRLTADEEIDHPERAEITRQARKDLEAAATAEERLKILASLSDRALRALGYFSFERPLPEPEQ